MNKLVFAFAILLQLNALGQTFKYEISGYPKDGNCHTLGGRACFASQRALATPAVGVA
ncbi:MAG: hypothetical protein R3B54_07265 [Bdellovibrionota bacterium]